jgi:hypothetical protein
MPTGVDAVLMPGYIAGIFGRLIKDQRTINQKIFSEQTFDGIQKIWMSNQTMGPVKKQMQAIESFERPSAAILGNRFKRAAKELNLVN